MKNAVFIIFITLLLGACTSKPILKEVENAILSAAKSRGWSPRVIKTGLIEANISVRSHRATIEIPYSETNYSINYKSSTNLNATDTKIHRNYNNWIVRLSSTIQRDLGVNAQKY